MKKIILGISTFLMLVQNVTAETSMEPKEIKCGYKHLSISKSQHLRATATGAGTGTAIGVESTGKTFSSRVEAWNYCVSGLKYRENLSENCGIAEIYVHTCFRGMLRYGVVK